MALSDRVREARERQQLSIRALATLTELDSGFLSRVEQGRQIPAADHVKRLADKLGVPARELVDERDATDLAVRRAWPQAVADTAVLLRHADPKVDDLTEAVGRLDRRRRRALVRALASHEADTR